MIWRGTCSDDSIVVVENVRGLMKEEGWTLTKVPQSMIKVTLR